MNEQTVVEVRDVNAMLSPHALLTQALYDAPAKHEQTQVEVRSAHALLKSFFIDERIAYQAHSTRARFDRNARKARTISHRVLAMLVPACRNLDKFLLQPTAGASYAFAPRNLASVLLSNFICATRLPDTHPVWQTAITAQQVKALVDIEPMVSKDWFASQEERYPGITAVLNGNGATLRDLRTAYISTISSNSFKQKRLTKLLAHLRTTLSRDDYALLTSNLRAPA